MGFMFCDLHVSLNNPSSEDINSSNLPCSFLGKHHISACYKRNFDFLASLCSCGDWFESHFV